MDISWKSILMSHFVWGLVIGLVIWFITIVRAFIAAGRVKKLNRLRVKSLQDEVDKLNRHMRTQVEIDSEANEERKKVIENMKWENENLRVTVQTLRQKPAREELIQLQIYDMSLQTMRERVPGFAPIWEVAVKEAREEVNKMHTGVIPFIKRIIAPSGSAYKAKCKTITDDAPSSLNS